MRYLGGSAGKLAGRCQAPGERVGLVDLVECHAGGVRNAAASRVCEIEWSVLSRRCTGQHLPDRLHVEPAVDTWEEQRNRTYATVTWRFTTKAARSRLARLYPMVASMIALAFYQASREADRFRPSGCLRSHHGAN